MKLPNYSLNPEWDKNNRNHILKHDLYDYQIEELYYNEGIYPTYVIKNKKNKNKEYRLKLLGVDAGGTFIKAIIAINSKKELWRCVTAIKMTEQEKRTFLKYIGEK